MPNMSYCRFRNTLNDLRDCLYNFTEAESPEEQRARKELLRICEEIVDNYGGMDLDELQSEVDEDFDDEDGEF